MELLQAPEGDVLAEHAATLTGRVAAVLFLILPAAGLMALAMQLEAKDADARMPLVVAGVVLGALGALGFVQQNRTRVVVRADGLERWGLRGKLWALRWSEMPELHYRVVKVRLGGLLGMLLPALGTNYHLAVVDPAGKKRKIPTGLKGIDVLAERVSEQQTTALLPAARAKLDAGEEVRFGKGLALDREKLSVRKFFGGMKSCALTGIEKVTVESGFLKIRQRGKTFAFARLQVGSVANVFLLLRLLDMLVGQKPAERDFAAQAHVA